MCVCEAVCELKVVMNIMTIPYCLFIRGGVNDQTALTI